MFLAELYLSCSAYLLTIEEGSLVNRYNMYDNDLWMWCWMIETYIQNKGSWQHTWCTLNTWGSSEPFWNTSVRPVTRNKPKPSHHISSHMNRTVSESSLYWKEDNYLGFLFLCVCGGCGGVSKLTERLGHTVGEEMLTHLTSCFSLVYKQCVSNSFYVY